MKKSLKNTVLLALAMSSHSALRMMMTTLVTTPLLQYKTLP